MTEDQLIAEYSASLGRDSAEYYFYHGVLPDGTHLTASKTAKLIGCQSLTQISKATGVSLQTLSNWHKHKPDLFRIVCIGVSSQPA